MKTPHSKRIASWLAVVALAVTGSSAFAASTWSWDFVTGSTGCGAVVSGGTYSSLSCSSGAGNPTANLTAWSTTKTASSSNVLDPAGTQFATANLDWYSADHIGVQNQATSDGLSTGTRVDVTSPQHSMDNSGQTDLILVHFTTAGADTAVDLDTVTIGWSYTDSDISVLRYTGSGTPGPSMYGQTVAGLTSNGWASVGDYANLAVNTARNVNTPANNSSSWWLISAYNSQFGGTCDIAGQCSNGNDYVKLAGLGASTTKSGGQAPEPGSLALMGAALAGMMAVRRRKRQAS